MELTHDRCLYVIEYDFGGRKIRKQVLNRCIYFDVEDVHFDLGMDKLIKFLKNAKKSPIVEIKEHVTNHWDEDDVGPYNFYLPKDDDSDTLLRMEEDPEFLKELIEKDLVDEDTEAQSIRQFRDTPYPVSVMFSDTPAGYFNYQHSEFGTLPEGMLPILSIAAGEYIEMYVDNFYMEKGQLKIKLVMYCEFKVLNEESAQHFKFYRAKPIDNSEGDSWGEEELVDWQTFCKGVMEQPFRKGREFMQKKPWREDHRTWTYSWKVPFENIFTKDKAEIDIEKDTVLFAGIQSVRSDIKPLQIHKRWSGCIQGMIRPQPRGLMPLYYVYAPIYSLKCSSEERNASGEDFKYEPIVVTSPSDFDAITDFMRGEVTPCYIHLTTDFVEDEPIIKGEVVLLKTFAGEEDEIQEFHSRLYDDLQRKSEYSRKIFKDRFAGKEVYV